jgi:hypothetical protein
MVCKKMKVLHFKKNCDGCGFLNKTRPQCKQNDKGAYIKQVIDEVCNNVRNYKTITMPSLKSAKIVDEKEQHEGTHLKP